MAIWILGLLVVGITTGVMWLFRSNKDSESGNYRRRFSHSPARDDGAFPVASTLYLGDAGSSSHTHHSHSADCSAHADPGGGCADGGSGGGGD